jgi:hypothetical protein
MKLSVLRIVRAQAYTIRWNTNNFIAKSCNVPSLRIAEELMTLKCSACYSFGGQFMLTFFNPVICKLGTQTGSIAVQYEQPCRTLVMVHFSCLLFHTITPASCWPHSLTCHHGCSFQFQASLFGICGGQRSTRAGFSPSTSAFSCQYHPIIISMYHYRCVNVATESIVKQDTLYLVFIATYRFVSFLQ